MHILGLFHISYLSIFLQSLSISLSESLPFKAARIWSAYKSTSDVILPDPEKEEKQKQLLTVQYLQSQNVKEGKKNHNYPNLLDFKNGEDNQI